MLVNTKIKVFSKIFLGLIFLRLYYIIMNTKYNKKEVIYKCGDIRLMYSKNYLIEGIQVPN